MRLMIFIDYNNFNHIISHIQRERGQDRVLDKYKLHNFVMRYLSNNEQYKNKQLTHIRTYLYTGEYTPALFKKIKDVMRTSENSQDKEFYQDLLYKAEKRQEGQKKLFERVSNYPFFEVRKKPLQFTPGKGIYQKGIDVQLAVDLVTNAYLNNYDIAVLFSGDIDLLESIRTIKNLGKNIIIFSHYHDIGQDMVRESDLFVDFQKIRDEQLDEFTHIFQRK